MNQEIDNIDWIQAVRRRLQQAELPVDQQAWDRIASRVDGKASPAAAPQRRALARRLWPWVAAAAAAVVAAIVVVTALLVPQPRRLAPAATAPAIAAAQPAPAPVPQPSPAPVETSRPAAARAHLSRHRAIEVPLQPQASQALQQWAQAPARDSVAPVDTARDAAGSEPLLASNETGQDARHNAAVATGAASSSKWAGYGGFTTGTSGDDTGLTAQVYGMGVMMAGSGGMGRSMPPDAMTYNTMLLAASAAPSYDYKHKIPIVVGFTVGKMLDYGLEATVGGSFSSYSSDVTNRLNGETCGQVVQLVGLPVGLRWHFASYRHFSAYVGAEGMVEWVTKAKFGSEHVHVGRAQWSGSGMLGVQYSLANHVAIFVEPKLTHYFNRLPLKTLRSEHDINMNVRVGLGFDF